jgi:hypothetical protein
MRKELKFVKFCPWVIWKQTNAVSVTGKAKFVVHDRSNLERCCLLVMHFILSLLHP